MLNRRNIPILLSLCAIFGSSACASLDKMDRKVDMAAGHLGSQKPMYEGRLTSSRVVGPMTALQFADGKSFDVDQAPSALFPGDILRIYKNDKGLEAHLWRANDDSKYSNPQHGS